LEFVIELLEIEFGPLEIEFQEPDNEFPSLEFVIEPLEIEFLAAEFEFELLENLRQRNCPRDLGRPYFR